MAALFLMGIAALIGLGMAFKQTGSLKLQLAKHAKKAHVISKGVSMLMIAVEFSELLRVIEHTSIVTVFAAAFMLAIIVASKSGTESEIP